MSLENYIIRIYRHEKNDPLKIVGTVEEVGMEGKKAFTNYDELWDILNMAGPDVLVEEPERKKERRRKT